MAKLVVGYVGLTHLGLNSAVASAAKGFNVIAFHDDPRVINDLNQGITTVMEPQLTELMSTHRELLCFTANPAGLQLCDLVYISVDVPTDTDGKSNLAPVNSLISVATSNMRRDADLIVLCQVPPGFTKSIEWPDDQLFYQVETLIFGKAMERALYPERFILGVADTQKSLSKSLVLYLASFNCPIFLMRYESAELAKIAINICLAASVSVANTLAEICEKIGGDWTEIVPALKLDKRIGQHAYLSPGLGIAGGNLERDLATIQRLSKQYETDSGVVSAFIVNSRHRRDWVVRTLRRLVLDQIPESRIALLGLTYKESTHSLKNSPAIALVNALAPRPLTAYDPAAASDAGGAHLTRKATALDAINGADVLAVMTPWPEFRTITAEQLKKRMRGRIVLDPYRVLDGKALTAVGFTYATLGVPATAPKEL